MVKVLTIVGPTASGKSALSVKLAKLYNGEIINGDSIQVYRQLNIGAAKISTEEKQGIPHHLMDILDYDQKYSVYDFQKAGREIIATIDKKHKLPVLVGGTGLHIKALLYDYQFSAGRQAKQDYQKYSNEELYAMIRSRDQVTAEKIHVNNRKRLLTNLILLDNLPQNKTEFLAQQKKIPLYDCLTIGLTLERNLLHQRINERVELMFEKGLVEEVAALVKDKEEAFSYQSLQAVGYKEFKEHYLNTSSLEDVKEKIKAHTRQVAKRQLTWFSNQMEVQWFDCGQENYLKAIIEAIDRWK